MIIAISGVIRDDMGNKGSAGAGKDTVADRLVEKYGFTKIGLADVMKRFCGEIFEFSDDQLWGSSKHRSTPCQQYPREVVAGTAVSHLTPRHALQTLGTWGRDMCWQDTWVAYTVAVAKKLQTGDYVYDARNGLTAVAKGSGGRPDVVISDVRYRNEVRHMKDIGATVIRVVRNVPIVIQPTHQSELDLLAVPDDEFDYVLHNVSDSLQIFGLWIDEMMDWLTGRIAWTPVDACSDAPPFMRGHPSTEK